MDILTLLLAAAAGAGQTPAAEPERVQPNEVLCRRVRSSTSRIDSRRVCKTAAEWAATARTRDGDMGVQDGMDPRARTPTTGCTGGMGTGPNQGPF